jgi:hypothetical protein
MLSIVSINRKCLPSNYSNLLTLPQGKGKKIEGCENMLKGMQRKVT